jgi:hypothetical protein
MNQDTLPVGHDNILTNGISRENASSERTVVTYNKGNNHSINLFMINVLAKQPYAQLQSQHKNENKILRIRSHKHRKRERTNYIAPRENVSNSKHLN